MERLIIDILEVAESLTSMQAIFAISRDSCLIDLKYLSFAEETGDLMAAVKAATNVHQPDQEHGRPQKDNFGNGRRETKEQIGFSRQC